MIYMYIVAEGEGFEPPELSLSGFQDHRLRPLGHPSAKNEIPPTSVGTTPSSSVGVDPASGRKSARYFSMARSGLVKGEK